MKSRVIETMTALEGLETAWWDLFRRCPSATPFQSPAWLIPWWHVFGPGELASVAVEEGGRLLALLPAYIEAGPHGRRLLPLGIGVTDYLDVLLDQFAGQEVGLALSEAVMTDDRWESWELEEMPPEAAGLRLPLARGMSEAVARQSACPVLDLAGPDLVPRSRRQQMRLARNRIARRSGVVRAMRAEEAPVFAGHLMRLHRARWAERGEPGVITGDVARFQTLALPALAATGLARLYVVEIEGEIVGAHCVLHHGDRAYYYIGGFDPDFAFESPGTVLTGHAIEAAGAEGGREFHFLRGQERYKYEWGAVDRWNSRRSVRRSRHD